MKLNQATRTILSLAGIALALVVLYYLRAIVVYFIVAAVLAFICEPLADALKRIRFRSWQLPSWSRALITLGVFTLAVLSILALIAPLVAAEVDLLSQIDPYETGQAIKQRIAEWQNSGSVLAKALGSVDVVTLVTEFLQGWLGTGQVSGIFGSVIQTISSVGVALFSIYFMAFFFLKDELLFSRIVLVLTPDKHLDSVKNILQHAHHLLRRYFIGLAMQSLIMMIIISLGLWLLGIDNALIIGILAGLLNVVPYLGPILALCIAVVVALTTALHLNMDAAVVPLLVKVTAVFLSAQTIDGLLVQPLVLGGSVRAHPLEIYVVILAAGILGGPAAMMVAIPGYTILRVVAREFFDEFKVVESLTRDLNARD